MRAGGYLSDQRHESWLVAGVCLALAAWVTACDVGELGALGRARFDTWSPCYSCPNARLVLPGARATIQVSTMTSWDAPCTNPGGRKTVGDPHVLALVGDPEYPPSSSCASIFIDVDGVAPGWTTVGITAPEDYYAFGTATGLAHLTVARVGGAWLDSAFADVDVRRLVVPAGTSEYLEAMLRDPDLVFIVPESVHWTSSDPGVASFAAYLGPWLGMVHSPFAEDTAVTVFYERPGSATITAEDRGIEVTISVEVLDPVDFAGRPECRFRSFGVEFCENGLDDDCDALVDESECEPL